MKKTTRSRLLLESVLALAIPFLLAGAVYTETLQSLIMLATRSSPTAWLSILVVAVGILCEFTLLGSLAQLIVARGNIDRINAQRTDPDRIRRTRHRRFALATVSLVFLVSFVSLEAVFRFFAIVPPEGKLQTFAPYSRVDNSLNSRGMREPWETIPQNDARRRIAFLGDSFVYGYGVEPGESFTSLVEEMLPDTVTINMGGIGFNPKEQYAVYLQLSDEMRPHVLVHVVYMNDLDFDLYKLLRTIHRIPKRDSWLAGQSYVIRYIEKQMQFRRAYRKSLEYFSGGETARQRAASWAALEKYVTLCKRAAEEDETEYRLVIFPWLYKLDDYPLRHIHEKMAAFADKLGVACLDLLEAFEGMDDCELRLNEVDSHPNAKGHRIAAEVISKWLAE